MKERAQSRLRRFRYAGLGAPLVLVMAPMLLAAPPEGANELGRKTYIDHCASCHGEKFGGAFGPPLNGPIFVAKWEQLSAEAFLDYVKTTMPPAAPGSLSDDQYAAVSAYVREHVGLRSQAAPRAPEAAPRAPLRPDEARGDALPDVIDPNVSVAPAGDEVSKAAAERLSALAAKLPPVTDAMLEKPDPSHWLSWRRTRDSHAYSPLQQINTTNAKRLTLAWALPLGNGTNSIAPLAYDGVIFINSGTVRALDAKTGDEIWKFARPATTSRIPLSQARGMALYGKALYVPTIDNHLIALDMRTGTTLWDKSLAPPEGRLQTTAAPIAVKGKIIQGISGCQGNAFGGGCYILALDAATGKQVWRFQTIARPGQEGGDSWNGAPLEKRFGGSVWTPPSYDAGLDLLYFGTAQTYNIATLLNPPPAPGSSTDALYTNSTLAIDPDTGKLAWHYQHFPGDVWDLDWSFEQTLATVNGRRTVFTMGKLGILDALDAKTGRYLWSKDLGLQNLVTAIDPKTGRKTYDRSLIPEKGKTKIVCPSALGVRNWLATAVDPTAGRLYVPTVDACMEIGMLDSADNPSGDLLLKTIVRPDSDGQFGAMAAIDLNTRQIAWQSRRRAPQASAALATAGGVLFEGSLDRRFRAVNGATGEVLWETRLDDTPHSFPITFMAEGTQYVAVVSGGGTPHDLVFRGLIAEEQTPARQRTLWVFKLAGG